jgi:serine/threonine-protein kinase RsbW
MRSPAHAAHARATHARTYPGRPDQIRAVRADLRALLAGSPLADDAILAASELAANAALHSNSCHPGGSFTVRAEIHPGHHIRIEVDDNGGPWTEPEPHPDRPHGLDIIRALTTDWGVRDTTTGRTAWSQLRWPAT